VRPNPKKLNALQLRTMAILQAIARETAFAEPPHQDGTVSIHTLPHRHGDHLHVGAALVAARDATGLDNPNVMNALARKGLLRHGAAGLRASRSKVATTRPGSLARSCTPPITSSRAAAPRRGNLSR
jgi:hypothetical protein